MHSSIAKILFIATVLVLGGCARVSPEGPVPSVQFEPEVGASPGSRLMSFTITSPAFRHEGRIPSPYTCDGEDINPSLEISGVPEGTKSLALIVDDPDAPRGDWVHWLVWNIAPHTATIAEDSVPAGSTEGTTDFNRTGWGGPCPPSGTHRYFFKLYALDVVLDLDASASKHDLEQAMESHIIDEAVLMGKYSRS